VRIVRLAPAVAVVEVGKEADARQAAEATGAADQAAIVVETEAATGCQAATGVWKARRRSISTS